MIWQYLIVSLIITGAMAYLVKRFLKSKKQRVACSSCPIQKVSSER